MICSFDKDHIVVVRKLGQSIFKMSSVVFLVCSPGMENQ